MANPKAVSAEEAAKRLNDLPGWSLDGGAIAKTFSFKNYYETMAFVNASAWISHREDHHPDLEVGYNKCRVKYSTHSVGGLSDKDFECAGKVEALL
jgi:4a-hydroxytetrahydrobiopterin dehydratase